MSEFAGKVVVVTGAGQGIGRSIALGFGAHGATVVLAARSEDKLRAVADEVAAAGGTPVVVHTDLRDPAAVDALRDATHDQAGPADVVVSNSGVAGPTAPLWEQTPEAWRETLDVNLGGVFLLCRAFLPAMVERGSGSVVVIGSMTGKRPLLGRSPYAASKAGLIGLVRTLAAELGPSGVRVNLVSPGGVAGPRLDGVIETQAQARGMSADAVRDLLVADAPLGRFVEPEQVADAALFLASERAAAITGEDLNVSAGATMH